jgi:hypothetical protein
MTDGTIDGWITIPVAAHLLTDGQGSANGLRAAEMFLDMTASSGGFTGNAVLPGTRLRWKRGGPGAPMMVLAKDVTRLRARFAEWIGDHLRPEDIGKRRRGRPNGTVNYIDDAILVAEGVRMVQSGLSAHAAAFKLYERAGGKNTSDLAKVDRLRKKITAACRQQLDGK